MLLRLPQLSGSCKDFVGQGQKITAKSQINKLALQHHTQLLELLEIPQLMDTCVRNGFYEEALQLDAFVQKLKKAFGTVRVVNDIAEEVKKCTDVMIFQLHHELRSNNVQLPVCLRIIGYLKRLGIYSERELRLSFLQSRGSWLHNTLSSIPTNQPYTYVKTYYISLALKN